MDLQKFSGGCRFSSVVQPVPGLQGLANLAEKDKADRSDRASRKTLAALAESAGNADKYPRVIGATLRPIQGPVQPPGWTAASIVHA